MVQKPDSARGILRAALPLLLLALWLGLPAPTAVAAIIKDYVRVSVKYIHHSNGSRPPGVYGIETSVATAFSDMNIILDRHDLRWRLLLVEVKDVSDSSEFFELDDSNFDAFERRARDEEPVKYHWRNDAINVYVVNSIDGAGGRASFPGNTNHRDIVTIASNIVEGEINNSSAGWLHEIGHYLSLKHTFQCSGENCTSDRDVCQGEGARHRGWSAKCPDVCPHDENIMSYDHLGWFGFEATRIGKFTECQIEHMNYELYDPRGDRGHVLQPCSQSCAELAAPCRDACEGTYDGCLGACDAVDVICDGGCGAAGDTCRGACVAAVAVCEAPCIAAEETCMAGCEAVCFFAPNSDECRDCRSACSSVRSNCAAPCYATRDACNRDCPSPSSCRAECDHQQSECHAGCAAVRASCLEPCRAIEEACLGDCPEPPATPTNWALRPGVATLQSSDYAAGFTSNLAVDGRLDTFSHTRAGTSLPAFLEVNLGVDLEIETIVLENRRDCCRSRLRDITVSILDAARLPQYTAAGLNAANEQGRTTLDGPARLVLHLPSANASSGGKVTGRIVRIVRTPDPTLAGTGGQGNTDEADVLSLAEVAVYGNAPPPPSDVNLTRQNNSGVVVSARQSSTGFGGDPERAIDGKRNGSYPSGSVTHTADGDPSPWWELDLGQTYPLGKIVLWNRTDCCIDRLHNFRVALLDGSRAEVHSSRHFTDGSFPDTSTTGYEIAAFGDDARFVRIELLGSINGAPAILSLAEVEVFTGPKGRRFVRGDADSSGSIDIADGVVTLSYLFLGGASPACVDAADANDDGSLAISDAVSVFTWLFSGGRAPAPPSPRTTSYDASDCGPDETQDRALDCATSGPACS